MMRNWGRRRAQGFTLLEVMIALAILAGALVVLLSISASDIRASHRAKLLTIATGLARAKMYDTEDALGRLGFESSDSACEPKTGDFGEEGQPRFTYERECERVSLPSIDQASTTPGGASGSAVKDPNDPKNQDDLLNLSGGSASGALGAGMVQMYFPLIQPVLENAIRKVTIKVHWNIGSEVEELKVIAFFTDTKAIDQAMRLSGGGGGGGGSGSGGAPAPTGPTGPTGGKTGK